MKELIISEISELSTEDLQKINGGASFAYRVGQLIRFMALGGGYGAYIDFVATEAINQVNSESND